jgi:hypothetical protein
MPGSADGFGRVPRFRLDRDSLHHLVVSLSNHGFGMCSPSFDPRNKSEGRQAQGEGERVTGLMPPKSARL